MIFDKAEDVWQLKWPPSTHLAWNWQLASLAYRMFVIFATHDQNPKIGTVKYETAKI